MMPVPQPAPCPVAPGLSAFATATLEIALEGRVFTDRAHVNANSREGFDLTVGDTVIQLAQDDCTWTLRLLDRNRVEYGSQVFTGSLARPTFVGLTVNGLL